jgi:hypothetical protein
MPGLPREPKQGSTMATTLLAHFDEPERDLIVLKAVA